MRATKPSMTVTVTEVNTYYLYRSLISLFISFLWFFSHVPFSILCLFFKIHELKAGPTGAAIWDIISPDYDGTNRKCIYYKEENMHETKGSSNSITRLNPYHANVFVETVDSIQMV